MTVLLFRRILNIEKSQARQMERRRERRYTPGRPFPLYASIEVEGEPRTAKVIDLSPGGAGLQVSGPSYAIGSAAKLHLMLEESWMEFPCRIAHVKTLPAGCRLGLEARFENFAVQKAYLQLLQPVAIGSAMRPVPPEEVRQDDPAMHKLVFSGTPGTELNVWRLGDATGELHSFLCQMDDYLVRGDTTTGVMQVTTRKQMERSAGAKLTTSPFKMRRAADTEIRLLFRWTMMNLPKEVPGDIRTFLQGFVD
jgi:hypothetical protein